jgi:hypothetical protein
VQLFKSLFCLQGNDNRTRFALINIATYIGLLTINAIFPNFNFFALVCLVLFTSIYGLTTRRRLRDSKLNINFSIGPSLAFALSAIVMLISQHAASYALLLLPVLFMCLLLTYPSKGKLNYIYGYNGPVQLTISGATERNQGQQFNRIEPTILDGQDSELLRSQEQGANNNFHSQQVIDQKTTGEADSWSSPSTNSETNTERKTQDPGEMFRELILANKKILALVVTGLILLSVSLLFFTKAIQPDSAYFDQKSIPATDVNNTRLDPITLPDSFSIMLSQYQGLIIHWQGDAIEAKQLWSIHSAQGDGSCQDITFNDDSKIRTLSVVAENSADYYANFSPLDTKRLINAIAFRGSFNLCGYNFSLKGSQAVLGKNPPYADIIEY